MISKQGFTLVELSIALVIVGLLVGGILVGQSLIDSAKINATAQQIQQFDAGVLAFKAKYKYLPGDAPGFGGNGNWLIERTNLPDPGISLNAMNVFQCEIANFWNNLDPKTYPYNQVCVNGDNSGPSANISGANKNVPAAKIGVSGSLFVASALAQSSGTTYTNIANIANYYVIVSSTKPYASQYAFFHTTSANSAVKPLDLLALDKKIDDGIADTGSVLSGGINSAAAVNYGSAGLFPLTTCSSGPTYAIDQTGYECTPLIRIGAQAGYSL